MDTQDSSVQDGEDQGDWSQIPGIDPPSRETLQAIDCCPPSGTAEAVIEYNGRLLWDYHSRSIMEMHPQIGVAGSAANRRFVDLFSATYGRLEDLRTAADLVMLYPPRT